MFVRSAASVICVSETFDGISKDVPLFQMIDSEDMTPNRSTQDPDYDPSKDLASLDSEGDNYLRICKFNEQDEQTSASVRLSSGTATWAVTWGGWWRRWRGVGRWRQ